MFELTNPLYLLGLLAGLVPVALHLWGKRKAHKVEFAALHFLFKSNKKIKRHIRLKDILMLLARVLACVVATLVLAQPITKCQSNQPFLNQEFETAVYVIDNSIVGSFNHNESTVLEKALTRINRQIQDAPPQTKMGVVFCDSTQIPNIEITLERATIVDGLSELRPSHKARQCKEAIQLAQDMAEQSKSPSSGVILAFPILTQELKDIQSMVSNAKVTTTQMNGMDVAMPNMGIQNISIESDIVSNDQYNVTVSIINRKNEDAIGQSLKLFINKELLAETTIDCPANEITNKVISLAKPQHAEKPWLVSASIEEDGFAIDNERHSLLHDHKRPHVMLVNGDPKRIRRNNETYFLETILSKNDHPFSTVDPAEITTKSIASADVIVLANVNALPSQSLSLIKSSQDKGIGLLISGGDQFDEMTYRDTMTSLFPIPPVGIHDVKHGGMRNDAEGLHIESWAESHPIFRKFLANAEEIRSALFVKHLLFPPSKDAYKTLASFNNGSPALIEFSTEKSRSIYYSSTLDRDWNDFSIYQGFVPWFLETLKYLSFKEGEVENNAQIGKPFYLENKNRSEQMKASTPEGKVIHLSHVSKDLPLEFNGITTPGLYSFRSEQDNGKSRPHFVVANADPNWMDLQTSPLPDASNPNTTKISATKTHKIWKFLSPIVLLLLLLEAFGSWRRAKTVHI